MKHLNLAELILHCRQNNEAESYFFIHASYLLVMNLPAFFCYIYYCHWNGWSLYPNELMFGGVPLAESLDLV